MVLGQARHIDRHGEEAAGMRECRKLLLLVPGTRGGHVERLQVRPAEADHGGAAGRNRVLGKKAAVGCIALDTPAFEERRPVASFRINRRAVGTSPVAFGRLKAHEQVLVRRGTGCRIVE